MFIRDSWVQASQFHSLPQPEVLGLVHEQVKEVIKKQSKPVVVFDLDSTLFDVGPRTFHILQEWIQTQDSQSHPELREFFSNLNVSHMRYSLEDLLRDQSQDPEDHRFAPGLKQVKTFWRKRFFSDPYVKYDQITYGAREFVQDLYNEQASIVYLTGRDIPGMGFGTRQQLEDHGFPIGDLSRTRLVMKPSRAMDDLEFKVSAIESAKNLGSVVASFENEPKNLVAMKKKIPQAMNVFIETTASDHPAPAGEGLYKIRHFVRS